jgi:hypothetical protein
MSKHSVPQLTILTSVAQSENLPVAETCPPNFCAPRWSVTQGKRLMAIDGPRVFFVGEETVIEQRHPAGDSDGLSERGRRLPLAPHPGVARRRSGSIGNVAC